MTTDQTQPFDSPMRSVTISIPTAIANKLNETFDGTLEDATLAGLKLLNGMGPVSYGELLLLAKQTETSPAKILRSAIKHFAEETTRLQPPTKLSAGRPKINEARDAKLYARIKSGITQAQVAAEFNLSIVRVGQIAARHRLIHGDAPRGRIPRVVRPEPAQPPQTVQPKPEAQEVLSLNDSAPQPKVLAVIPPSMRNPELFRSAEERPQPVPADKLNMDIFQDDYPLEQVYDLRGVEPGRVAYTNTPKK
jgi:hypothetical protein